MSWYDENKKAKKITNEKWINWFESLETHEIKAGDLTVYRSLKNKCLGCGCPEDKPQMKNSTDAYYCLFCHKKMIGEEAHNKLQAKLNNWEDKTQEMNTKEIPQIVKKSLMFGG